MVNFNFEINAHGKTMSTVVDEIAHCIKGIEELGELKDKTVQSILASGFEINFNFFDKPESLVCDSSLIGKEFPIDSLNLSVRTRNCLTRAGITSVEQLKEASFWEVSTIRNLGSASLRELASKILELRRREMVEKRNRSLNTNVDD